MATTKLSVTGDTETLDRIKRFLPDDVALSAFLNEALRKQLEEYEELALLDEMDRVSQFRKSTRGASICMGTPPTDGYLRRPAS